MKEVFSIKEAIHKIEHFALTKSCHQEVIKIKKYEDAKPKKSAP
jgi:hypothetical protein